MNWVKKLHVSLGAVVYIHRGRIYFEPKEYSPMNLWGKIVPRRSICYLLIMVPSCAGMGLYLYIDHQTRYDGLFQVVFLDVGQGTGVYIKTPSGKELIYDIGPRMGSLRSLEQFRPWHDRSIDYLIGSHADSDHVGMMPRMIDSYTIGQIVLGPGNRDTALYKRIQGGEQYQNNRYVSRNDTWVIDAHTYLRVLHPEIGTATSANDDSLVIMVHMGDVQLLLTGDISKTVEQQLIKRYGQYLNSDLLLVSHHGSQTSSDIDFVRTVSPILAVVSAGKDNRYGHPHRSVTSVFEQLGIRLERTDERGSIHVVSDGKHLLLQ